MSLKQEIQTWVEALAHYDNNEFEEALKTFDAIADTSRILFNCAVIHATLGQHQKAVERYQRAIRCDQYLAVAYFQQGVSNFLIGNFEEALTNFNDTLLYLRGNSAIDYEQLGLNFKLFSCEVLFNRGLCYIYLQQKGDGMRDFAYAVKEKVVDVHNVIDEAIQDEAEGYTVFSIPVGVVYRPNSAKVRNLKTKDYLGKARLVAATTRNNTSTGFTGPEFKKNTELWTTAMRDDRPPDSHSFAGSNLVKPGRRWRTTRQRSEPPMNRQIFPPTPPPESEKLSPFRRSNETDRPLSSNWGGMATGTEHDRVSSPGRPVNGGGRRHEGEQSQSVAEGVERLSSDLRNYSMGSNEATERPLLFRFKTEDGHRQASVLTDRVASVRPSKVRPPRLEARRAETATEEMRERPRPGTIRTASEPRGPSRGYYLNAGAHEYTRARMGSWDRSIRPLDIPEEQAEEDESSSGDPYDGHRPSPTRKSGGSLHWTPTRGHHQPNESIEEESMEAAVGERTGSSGDGASEVNRGVYVYENDLEPGSHRRFRRSASRKPEIRKIRIKVHVGEDTRYILLESMSTTNMIKMEFGEFINRVRDKFQLRHRFKCTVRDDGDLITLGDQDDLDLALSTCTAEAIREGSDMAKMEVWVVEAR